MHSKHKYIWAVVVGVIIFLIFNKHSKGNFGTYQHTVWADKSGYYVFLPMVFEYGFDAEKMPDGIENRVGNGFTIDSASNKMITKYNCGVSILQAPFYLLSKSIPTSTIETDTQGMPIPTEYSFLTMAFMHLGAAFFFSLGLYLLYGSLKVYFSTFIVISSLLAMVFGSNVLHYAIDETLMTHLYSFFWFSVALHSCIALFKKKQQQWNHWIYLCLAVGFIVLLRPTNVVFLVALFILFYDKQAFKNFFIHTLSKKIGLAVLLIGLVFLPQLLYWNYAYGSLVVDTYQSETFSNWRNPKFLETLFSPNNGLFLYSPMLIFTLIGGMVMLYKKEYQKWVFAIGFAFVSILYITASWWTYDFGCGFGSRNFVEYSVLFTFPIAYLLERSKQYKLVHYSIITVMVLMVLFITQLTYVYDECWFGRDNWDFAYYWDFVF
jgi:hypothetical protein